MRNFTFHMLDTLGKARTFDLQSCSSEYLARQELSRLFDQHPSAASVEVWDESGPIFRAARTLGSASSSQAG